MAKKLKRYEVLVPVRSDKRKKYYDVGEVVTSNDFPRFVIEDWLRRSILAEVKDGSDD